VEEIMSNVAQGCPLPDRDSNPGFLCLTYWRRFDFPEGCTRCLASFLVQLFILVLPVTAYELFIKDYAL